MGVRGEWLRGEVTVGIGWVRELRKTLIEKFPPRLPSANSTISVDRVELSATICFFDYYLTIVERK